MICDIRRELGDRPSSPRIKHQQPAVGVDDGNTRRHRVGGARAGGFASMPAHGTTPFRRRRGLQPGPRPYRRGTSGTAFGRDPPSAAASDPTASAEVWVVSASARSRVRSRSSFMRPPSTPATGQRLHDANGTSPNPWRYRAPPRSPIRIGRGSTGARGTPAVVAAEPRTACITEFCSRRPTTVSSADGSARAVGGTYSTRRPAAAESRSGTVDHGRPQVSDRLVNLRPRPVDPYERVLHHLFP